MAVGGSAGLSSVWSLDITEGTLTHAAEGRRWQVRVSAHGAQPVLPTKPRRGGSPAAQPFTPRG
jgi:hypothetical protein